MEGPDSSYSLLAIHICWKVDRDARMEPPIQTEYLRSGGATTWPGHNASLWNDTGPPHHTSQPCPPHASIMACTGDIYSQQEQQVLSKHCAACAASEGAWAPHCDEHKGV